MLSKNYKNLYALIWHFWSPKGRKQQFEKPVNAGWKPTSKECDQSEPSVIFDRIVSAPTTSTTLVAPSSFHCMHQLKLQLQLNSPVTSTLAHLKPTTVHEHLLKILTRTGKHLRTSFKE